MIVKAQGMDQCCTMHSIYIAQVCASPRPSHMARGTTSPGLVDPPAVPLRARTGAVSRPAPPPPSQPMQPLPPTGQDPWVSDEWG